MYFLVHKVKRNRSIWGPSQFLVPDTHSEHHLENVFLCLKLCLEQPETLTKNIFVFRVHCELCMYLGCSKCGGHHG